MDYFDIFAKCFPMLDISREIFYRLAMLKLAKIIEYRENNKICGFAAVEETAVRLLCVLPEYQCRGIGSRLLKSAEELIKNAGGGEAVIGGAASSLLIGVPEKAVSFFQKHGYECVGMCEEMSRSVQDFNSDDFDLPVPQGTELGWYDGDIQTLKNAVADVDEDWAQYFDEDSRVFCGFADGEIASFCMIDYDDTCILSNGTNKVGIIGCVGTVHRHRKKGIGLKMVAKAMDILRKGGSDVCFIHYTGVAHWYSRIGFKTFLKLFFCKKDI